MKISDCQGEQKCSNNYSYINFSSHLAKTAGDE